MSATWPATLPQKMFFGYERKTEPNVIEFEVSSGPPKVRRRSTKRRVMFSTQFQCNGAQVETFDAFFEDDLSDGTLPFTWTNPITGDSTDFRFVKPPVFKEVVGSSTRADRIYDSAFELEVM